MLSAVFVTFAILLDRTKIMIVCIAEKPSVARDIADVLGAKTKKDGYIEGNGYQVTWTFGHLCTLKEPHEYTPSWKAWSLSSLRGAPESRNRRRRRPLPGTGRVLRATEGPQRRENGKMCALLSPQAERRAVQRGEPFRLREK